MTGPLSTNANRTRSYDQTHYHEDAHAASSCEKRSGRSWLGAVVLFIVVLVIVWALIFWLNPECLQVCDKDGHYEGKADAGKTFLAALVFAFILLVILGLCAVGCGY